MDKDVVKNAIGGIDNILSKAKRALREMEFMKFGGWDNEGAYESPEDAMVWHIHQLYDHLLVVLEAAEMPDSRANLITKWAEFKKRVLHHTDQFGDFDHLTSPVLEYVEHLVSALRMTVSNEITSEEAWTLERLEELLNDADTLLHRHDFAPSSEKEFQNFMHDYLMACFPYFEKDPQIGGGIKNFEPDCGISNVNAAIEFKIAHTEAAAKVAFSGVVEDTAGYKGSKQWTRFYAVIYQAKPFLQKSHMKRDMKRIGAATWTPILLNGKTAPRKKSAKATKAKPVKRARPQSL
jgi:hypothetical protein